MRVGDIEKRAPHCSTPEKAYTGSGSAADPHVVDWDLNDPEDPYNWPRARKWLITAQVRTVSLRLSLID